MYNHFFDKEINNTFKYKVVKTGLLCYELV